MKGLKIVKWEKGAPWPEVIEWRDQGEFSSETHYQRYGWCWRNYCNEMVIYFANDKGNRMRFGKRHLEGSRTWEDTYSRSGKVRSKTFPGIAEATAEQWGRMCEI